jgi:HPr kinase/phosphorylase
MSETVHATAVLAGATGVLIRGPSGAGKSTLAAAIIGRGGRLVGDDSVHLSAAGGRIVATRIGALAGQMEIHGRGIVTAPCEPSGIVRLIVDLVDQAAAERMPEEGAFTAEILGIALPRQPIPARSASAVTLLESALDGIDHDWRRGLRSA